MGRLRTVGWEVASTSVTLDGGTYTGSGTIDTTVFRSGQSSLKLFESGGNGLHKIFLPSSQVNDTGLYFRFYFKCPNTSADLFEVRDSVETTRSFIVRLTGAGTKYLQLLAPDTVTQIGSNSNTLVIGQWYRVEVYCRPRTGAGLFDDLELRLDGSTVASSYSTTDYGMGLAYAIRFFNSTVTPIYFDDFAVNDTSGANQNSWPGEGKIVLLKPISDNARGANWTAGGGGTTNIFNDCDNTPPIGAGTPAAGTQIKNIAKDAAGNYDANLTTYRNAGITDADIITLVHPMFSVGCNSTTSTSGAEQFVSNPTGPAETAMDFDGNSFPSAAWASDWRNDWLAAIHGNITTANRGVSPVIRIGKRQSATREAYCAFMGAYVEYVKSSLTPALLTRQSKSPRVIKKLRSF